METPAAGLISILKAKTFEICEKCCLKKILYFARKIFESFVIFSEIVLDNLEKECYSN